MNGGMELMRVLGYSKRKLKFGMTRRLEGRSLK
jgi:hypothetical protein